MKQEDSKVQTLAKTDLDHEQKEPVVVEEAPHINIPLSPPVEQPQFIMIETRSIEEQNRWEQPQQLEQTQQEKEQQLAKQAEMKERLAKFSVAMNPRINTPFVAMKQPPAQNLAALNQTAQPREDDTSVIYEIEELLDEAKQRRLRYSKKMQEIEQMVFTRDQKAIDG